MLYTPQKSALGLRSPRRLRRAAVMAGGVLAVGIAVAACGGGPSTPGVATGSTTTFNPASHGCDALVSAPVGHDCLLPWPNNAFTEKSNTATGLKLDITSAETPANVSDAQISPTYQDQEDGFSPGSVIMTYIPYLSLANSRIVDSTDIAGSLTTNSPIVIVNMKTGAHVPYFAELDAQNPNPASQLLLIRPAYALTEGQRYAVVLRNLKNTSNGVIAPAASTVAALTETLKPASRGAYIKNLIRVQLHSLLGGTTPYMAWDFTVASEFSIAGQALTMRDQAYKTLKKNGAPPFTVSSVTTSAGVRTVQGTFQVPLFLKSATNSSWMKVNKAGLPEINGKRTWPANFICVMPSTIQSGGPALPAVYGHGLLGDASEVEGLNFSDKVSEDMMGCATDWLGLDSNDISEVIGVLGNLSDFQMLSDQMLQGFVNFQFLGRLINSPDGFATSGAFKDGSGHVLFQVGKCTYVGYSQGGIMGAAVSAISNEWTRVFLGQGGMDYGGLLLQRSVDWTEYQAFLNKAYPNLDDQQIGLQLVQLLWDRGEADGYAQDLTSDPYPGTKVKQVFLIENYGDHQVANVGTEMLARTITAAEYAPAFTRGSGSFNTSYGLGILNQSKPVKAALELWDFGTLAPPTDNLAPTNGSGDGADPHSYGRGVPLIDSQIIAFLKTGIVRDVCGHTACQATIGTSKG
jgi:hypothetical protein